MIRSPKIEIIESPVYYDIKAELPGIAKRDLTVKIVGENLFIKGFRKKDILKDHAQPSFSEFQYGEYERTIHLDKKIEPKTMKLKFQDGIVFIHVEKLNMDSMSRF